MGFDTDFEDPQIDHLAHTGGPIDTYRVALDFEDTEAPHLEDTGELDSYGLKEDFEDLLATLYLVNAPKDYDLALSPGGITEKFVSSGFSIERPTINDQGVSSMNISMDNTNLVVSDYVQGTLLSGDPVNISYRVYLQSDPSTPQTYPPLELVLSDVKTTLFTVQGTASFADIVNLKFLTQKYTRERFPGLGN